MTRPSKASLRSAANVLRYSMRAGHKNYGDFAEAFYTHFGIEQSAALTTVQQ